MLENISKILVVFVGLFVFGLAVSAENISDSVIVQNMTIQKQIDDIGFNLLNSNRIDKHIIFTYQNNLKKVPKVAKVSKSQIIVYDNAINYAQTDDEKAAMLAIKISNALLKYGNYYEKSDVFYSPRKFEIFADAQSIDYLVNAGYNPLGMITYINKSCPQKLSKLSRHNTSTQRMAHIYENIFIKYPYFLKNNKYIDNVYYQNFLLNSMDNRRELEKKLKYHYSFEARYE